MLLYAAMYLDTSVWWYICRGGLGVAAYLRHELLDRLRTSTHKTNQRASNHFELPQTMHFELTQTIHHLKTNKTDE